jgi:hypothetical protein
MNKSIITKKFKRKSSKTKISEADKRKEDFARLLEPEEHKQERLVLRRKIYYNQRQYVVKIPKEIADYIRWEEGDEIEYELIISPDSENHELKIRYKKHGRT